MPRYSKCKSYCSHPRIFVPSSDNLRGLIRGGLCSHRRIFVLSSEDLQALSDNLRALIRGSPSSVRQPLCSHPSRFVLSSEDLSALARGSLCFHPCRPYLCIPCISIYTTLCNTAAYSVNPLRCGW